MSSKASRFLSGHFWAFGLAGILLFAAGRVAAQQPFSNLHTRVLDARVPLQALDSFTVAAPLVSVTDSATGRLLDPEFFSLENNRLRIDTARLLRAFPTTGRLFVNYRTLPADLGARVQRLDTALIRNSRSENAIEYDYSPYEAPTKPWESSGLRSNGFYTRGLSFGNSQNLAFNSNLNLQLDGRLGNDLELRASLSDNSIPIQPDGTTRQLKEFDRIFVELRRKDFSLTAGDFDLNRPAGYFSNYFKRVQGAMLNGALSPGLKRTAVPADNRPQLKLRTAAAVSKGKFSRQTIAGLEGNQGPYRLQGAEGERFIIVLAGTEKVYLDGQQLRRGLEDDYTIDYNLGELSFTPRRLISKDSRIIIEFEYAVQTYLRSTAVANLEYRQGKALVYLNAYSEQDGKNSGGAQDLSPAERRRLAEVGDRLQDAYASGIDTLDAVTAADPSRVLYESVDTLACGLMQTVLVYSPNSDSARYAARFTEVPQGQGNYVLVRTAANGRVYRWVAPDTLTCQPKGNFEPVVRLIAPESRQLFTVGANLQVSKQTELQTELALSNRDLNRFSPLGNADNAGLAGFVQLRQKLLPAAAEQGWDLSAAARYEYAGRQFSPLNPYRTAEFARDWNIGTTEAAATEHWARGGMSLKKTGWGNAGYEFGLFVRDSLYQGRRHLAQLDLARAGFALKAETNQLSTDAPVLKTVFSRPKIDFSKTFLSADKKPLLRIGVSGELENNERRNLTADTLNATSYRYELGRVYLQKPDSNAVWQWGLSWMHRNDFVPKHDQFQQNTAADEANVNGGWKPAPAKSGSAQSLRWNLSYRQLQVRDPELTTLMPQQTYLGRIDYNLTALHNALAWSTGYEVGSGQSPKVEFNYIRVNPGEGQFTWVDRNRDSILQVDEMEIAVFEDQKNYVRIAVTTSEYVRTNNVTLDQSLRLDPRLLWARSEKGWQRLLSRLSSQSNLQVNRRLLAAAHEKPAWSPFDAVPDSALIAVNSVIRQVLFVNRADPRWDASLALGDTRSRTALTTGFESRHLNDKTLHGRANFGQPWSLELDLVQGRKENDSELFNARDYRIDYWKLAPQLSWVPARSFRTVVGYTWQDSRNASAARETATQSNWSVELSWNPAGKADAAGFRPVTSLRAKGTFAQIKFSGVANSAIAYAMLDALQDGKNYLWSLNLDRQLSRSVQISLNYEGRKTGDNRVVHVGRAQVRAIF